MSDKKPFVHPDKIAADIVKGQFLELMKERWNVYLNAKELGINRTLVYTQWLHDPEFKIKFDEIRDSHLDGAEANLMFQAQHDKKAYVPAIFMLKSHRPEVYDRSQVIDVHHTIAMNSEEIKRIAGESLAMIRGEFTVVKEGKIEEIECRK